MAITLTGILFLSLAASCGILSGFLTYQEIGEVNRKLPNGEQIPYVFMYPGKMRRIKAEYKRFYPDGQVEFWRMTFQVAGAVFLALTAIASGFFK